MIEKMLATMALFDMYGPLLTKKQQAIMRDYYYEDLSYQEIADNLQVSKNAIYDTIKRAHKLLSAYEAKLHLVQQKQQLAILFEKLQALQDEKVSQILKEYNQEENYV